MMDPMDPQDASLIPPRIRREALYAAEQAVGDVLTRHGYRRDFFGRLELLDLALDEAEAELDAQLPPELSN